jgi:HPt (histidine-containing phosphotransfer) domain-containing protein
MEGYIKVLETYCRDAEKRLEILSGMPDGIGLALFTTQVHALKSASASIGASEISRMAAELEEAGKNGDTDFIGKNLAAFRENLSGLVGRIKPALAEYAHSGENVTNPGESGPAFRETLSRLRDALEAEDIGEANGILDEIANISLDRDMARALSSVSDHMLVSELKEAALIVDDLLRDM